MSKIDYIADLAKVNRSLDRRIKEWGEEMDVNGRLDSFLCWVEEHDGITAASAALLGLAVVVLTICFAMGAL